MCVDKSYMIRVLKYFVCYLEDIIIKFSISNLKKKVDCNWILPFILFMCIKIILNRKNSNKVTTKLDIDRFKSTMINIQSENLIILAIGYRSWVNLRTLVSGQQVRNLYITKLIILLVAGVGNIPRTFMVCFKSQNIKHQKCIKSVYSVCVNCTINSWFLF